jgi:hypothetical protein
VITLPEITTQNRQTFAPAIETAPRANAQRYKRRSDVHIQDDQQAELERRRPGALVMAGLAMLALVAFRLQYDSLTIILAECLVGAAALWVACRGFTSPMRQKNESGTSRTRAFAPPIPLVIVASLLCVVCPFALDPISRQMGAGNGSEIVMLACLAWGGMSLAFTARTVRTLSLSVVATGFLSLFTCFISDFVGAVLFVYAWVAVCLWWLLSNHWSAVECVTASQIQRTPASRWGYLALATGLFMIVTAATWNRVPVLRKLQAEIMPTSGGTSQRDSAARSGVGDGDALVAARKHATSFGAVETDIFLDSEKPSLFDVLSEEFGEPKKKDRVERAQALSPNETDSEEGKFSEANRSSGGSEFSIDRDRPKQRKKLDDLYAESLMYWEGRSGIRLAAQRYAHFDGLNWLPSHPDQGEPPAPVSLDSIIIDERTWFRPTGKPIQNSISPFVDSIPEALRFTRFRSPQIPAHPGLQLWSIDQLTMSEFFTYQTDDSLFMPGREHVPDYTVVRFVDSRIDQERVEKLLRNCAPGKSHAASADRCQSKLANLAHEYAGEAERGWEEVHNVIAGLRRNFEYSRVPVHEDKAPLEGLLAERKGPSYLIATAAALMLDHLGYETRLTTGFYVSPNHYDAKERATAILPQDAHTWLEVHAGHGYWIPLEPTTGFREPRFRAGWMYLARQNWKAIALATSGTIVVSVILYSARAFLFMLICRAFAPVLTWLPKRRQVAWLCWMLDVRWSLIGTPRPSAETRRKCLQTHKWNLDSGGFSTLNELVEMADMLRFAKEPSAVDYAPNGSNVVTYIHRIRTGKKS